MDSDLPYFIGYAIGIALFVWFVRALWHGMKESSEKSNFKPGTSRLDGQWREEYYQDPHAPYTNPGAHSPHAKGE